MWPKKGVRDFWDTLYVCFPRVRQHFRFGDLTHGIIDPFTAYYWAITHPRFKDNPNNCTTEPPFFTVIAK